MYRHDLQGKNEVLRTIFVERLPTRQHNSRQVSDGSKRLKSQHVFRVPRRIYRLFTAFQLVHGSRKPHTRGQAADAWLDFQQALKNMSGLRAVGVTTASNYSYKLNKPDHYVVIISTLCIQFTPRSVCNYLASGAVGLYHPRCHCQVVQNGVAICESTDVQPTS